MNRYEIYEDLSFILYIFPIIINGLYGVYLWMVQGTIFSITVDIYLTITQNIYIFLAGVLAIFIATFIDVWIKIRESKVQSFQYITSKIRNFGLLCFVLSLLSAWSATGFTFNPVNVFDVFVKGQYALLYPILLFSLSFLLTPSIKGIFKRSTIVYEFLPLILILLSPILMYVLWRSGSSVISIFLVSFSSFIAGIAILIYHFKKEKIEQ